MKKEKTAVITFRNAKGNTNVIKAQNIDALGAEFKELTDKQKETLNLSYGLQVVKLTSGYLKDAGMPEKSVFVATALSAAVGTLIMGIFAKFPMGLAPGVGLNAFFTYTVVFGMGCSWQFALTAVLIEGILFILLSVFGVREAIINSIPASLSIL